MTRGSCLCGAITYAVDGPLRPVVACHCNQCRKTSGHYVSATSARGADVTISGAVRWFQSSPEAQRGFCPTCGSNLFWDRGDGHLSIFAGTIDGTTGLTTRGHIFCADKGDYYDLPEGVPLSDADDSQLTAKVP